MADDFLSEMEADVSEDKVLEGIDKTAMHAVAMLAQKQVELEQTIAEKEADVKALKKKLYVLSSDTIPEKMRELGIKGFEMDTGESLSIKRVVTASISEKNKKAAHKWLVDHGHGDLIKHTVTTKFTRGEEDKAKELVNDLNEAGLNYDVKQAVHAMTLKAFVNEQLTKGNDIDMELLGVFEYDQTKITQPK
jgi:hypothetical protein